MTFIKIPIQLYDGVKKDLLGLEKPETCDASAYIDISQIESIRHGSDDKISEELNTEGSVIMMRSGDSFSLRMSLDELIELLNINGLDIH